MCCAPVTHTRPPLRPSPRHPPQVVREASRRVLGLRPFDVQLIGGMILHEGQIAEMRTGEGKTLVAVLPSYLNALADSGVHVVTVNDYLARRDSEWVGQVRGAAAARGGRGGVGRRVRSSSSTSSLYCLVAPWSRL